MVKAYLHCMKIFRQMRFEVALHLQVDQLATALDEISKSIQTLKKVSQLERLESILSYERSFDSCDCVCKLKGPLSMMLL